MNQPQQKSEDVLYVDDLTKQQQYIITNLYKIFKDRQKRGLSRSESKNFKSSDEVHKEFFDYLNKEDFIADTRTLKAKIILLVHLLVIWLLKLLFLIKRLYIWKIDSKTI